MSETLTKRELYDKLATLMDEQRTLMAKLDRSLRIEGLWPEAFKDGQRCSASITGSPSQGFDLVLKRDDGEEKRYTAATRILGRALLREKIERMEDGMIRRAMKQALSEDVWS
jgi:hypothetical protein